MKEKTATNNISILESYVLGEINSIKSIEGIDQRLVSIAFTDIQKGFMVLDRAVAGIFIEDKS